MSGTARPGLERWLALTSGMMVPGSGNVEFEIQSPKDYQHNPFFLRVIQPRCISQPHTLLSTSPCAHWSHTQKQHTPRLMGWLLVQRGHVGARKRTCQTWCTWARTRWRSGRLATSPFPSALTPGQVPSLVTAEASGDGAGERGVRWEGRSRATACVEHIDSVL